MNTVRKAVLWSAVDQFGQQGLRFLLYVLLARLLSPAEFGLIGMLAVFFAAAQVFADSGLSAGLVQRQINSDDDETTVFYINIAAGVFLTLLLCIIAPLVAAFYHQPILRPLLYLASCQILFSSFGIVQFALLMRDMDFRRQAIISVVSVCLSGAVAIGMAICGMGVWSLVAQLLTATLTNTVLLWMTGTWRPRGRFRRQSLQNMWPFGSRLLATNLISQVFENLYNVAIGRVYSAKALGLYTRANQMVNFPTMTLLGILNRVVFPHFSRLQDDPERLLSTLRRVIRLTLALTCLALAALAAAADQIVMLLLTPKWMGCVPYIRVLCIAGLFLPLSTLHMNLLTAKGRSGLLLRIEIVKRIMQMVVLAVTWRYGVGVIVVGYAGVSVASYFVNAFYNTRLIHYHWHLQAADILPIIAAGIVASGAAWSTGCLHLYNAWAQLALLLTVTTGVYIGIAYLLRTNSFADMWQARTDGIAWIMRRNASLSK